MTAPVIGQRAEADKLSPLFYRSVNIAYTVELLPSFWSNDPDDLTQQREFLLVLTCTCNGVSERITVVCELILVRAAPSNRR